MDDDFYGDYGVEDEKKSDTKKSKKKKESRKYDYDSNDDDGGSNKVLVIILGVLLIVLAILLIVKFYPKLFGNKEPVKFTTTQYNIYSGQSTLISYSSDYNLTWTSNDETVCTVENNRVNAIKTGTCIVTVSGVDKNGSNFKYDITVNINEAGETPVNPSGELSLDISSSNSGWSNSDVKVNVRATGYTKLVYVINCNGTCDYKNVNNSVINVTNDGENKVTVIASKGNQEIKKEVTVKIDKSKPTCSLNASNSTINATVNDSVSGIKKKGFNKDYSDNSTSKSVSSVGTFTYYVMDNAGNTNTCNINVSGTTQYRTASCTKGKSCSAAGCSEYDDTKWTDATDTDGICTGRTSDVTSGDIRCVNCSSGSCKFQTTVCKTPKRSIDKCGCETWGEFGAWTNEPAQGNNYLKVETRVVIK